MDEWRIGFISELSKNEFYNLPEELIADSLRVFKLIRTYGLENVKMPHVRHLTGKLWEIRVKDQNQIARSLYVTLSGKRVAVTRVFIKKTSQTPPKEIKLALDRFKIFTDEEGGFLYAVDTVK